MVERRVILSATETQSSRSAGIQPMSADSETRPSGGSTFLVHPHLASDENDGEYNRIPMILNDADICLVRNCRLNAGGRSAIRATFLLIRMRRKRKERRDENHYKELHWLHPFSFVKARLNTTMMYNRKVAKRFWGGVVSFNAAPDVRLPSKHQRQTLSHSSSLPPLIFRQDLRSTWRICGATQEPVAGLPTREPARAFEGTPGGRAVAVGVPEPWYPWS